MDQTSPGINKPPKQAFYYYDGSAGIFPAGWYEVGKPAAGRRDTNVGFVAGVGAIIRKAAGAVTAGTWTASPSYAR